MFFDLEKFRKCVAESDDELVLEMEMALAAITEIEYLRAGIATTALALRRLVGQDIPLTLPNVGPAPVERQRSAAVADVGGAGLTPEEREAVEFFAELRGGDFDSCLPRAATLRNLLERTK
jgi:hypothetical protein